MAPHCLNLRLPAAPDAFPAPLEESISGGIKKRGNDGNGSKALVGNSLFGFVSVNKTLLK